MLLKCSHATDSGCVKLKLIAIICTDKSGADHTLMGTLCGRGDLLFVLPPQQKNYKRTLQVSSTLFFFVKKKREVNGNGPEH